MAKTRSAGPLSPPVNRIRPVHKSRRRRCPVAMPYLKQRLRLQKRNSQKTLQNTLKESHPPSQLVSCTGLQSCDPCGSNRSTSREKRSVKSTGSLSVSEGPGKAPGKRLSSRAVQPILTNSDEGLEVAGSSMTSAVLKEKSKIKPFEPSDAKRTVPKHTASSEVRDHQNVSERNLRKRPFLTEAHSGEKRIVTASSMERRDPFDSRLLNLFSGGINKENIRPRNTIFESDMLTKVVVDENTEELKRANGWTAEQDSALQNAYFQVLPSSNFWFEVSKKVTGKTAKECFDRFYSAYPTPPAAKCRSRKSTSGSPMRTISFPSPKATSHSKRHFGKGKQGLLKAHQAVRHIFRKQKVADENYEADVFSAVEEQDTLSHDCSNVPVLSSLVRDGDVTHSDRSPSYSVKGLSYMSSSENVNMESQLQSPEVLKNETNPKRLDKYLDMLHLRKTQKKNTCKGETQEQSGDKHGKEDEARLSTNISAARDAIILGAREVLKMALKGKAAMEEETEDESNMWDDPDEDSQ